MTVARSSSPKVFGLRPFKVMVSAITLVAFFVNIFSYDLITLRQLGFSGQAWAAGTPLGLSGDGSKGAGGSGLFNELKVDTFALPENLGRVQFSWSAPHVKDRGRQATIIHIQDAHCNYAAQKQVAAIIEYLRGHYGIEIVNMEGGSGGYDLSVFTDIADGQKRRQVSDYFVREGLVSGGEYAAINDPEKIKLWGIEDPALYLANLNIYLESLSYRDDAEALLKSLSTSLSALKPKVYSKELLEFDMEYGAYKAGNIPFKDHLVYVLGRAGVLGTGVDKFRNLSLLGRALEAESGIDFKKADKDRDELIDRMHKKISRDDVEEIVAKTVEFKKEKISQKQFHDYLDRKSVV